MNITNEDNMELMARYPDNHFDLAIVDPPYGLDVDSWDIVKPTRPNYTKMVEQGYKKYKYKGWDKEIPKKEYFDELFRVSKNQIIWGGNYFTDFLYASRGWVYWNKGDSHIKSFNFSHGELAWTSFKKRLLSYQISPFHNTRGGKDKIHPTEKPVKLYEWILHNYAEKGQKILDTHLGSGSIAIACHNLGYDLTACELDKEYYEAATKRLKQHTQQLRIAI